MLDIVASLDSYDETDSYTVSLAAGVQYFLEVDCASGGTTHLSLLDSFLFLYGPRVNGPFIASDDDGGLGFDSRIVFTPTVSGNYRVDVAAYDPGQMGTYRLTVQADDLRGTVEGIGPLGQLLPGGSASGTVDFIGDGVANNGDVDVFAVTLVAGLRYSFSVLGAETGDGTLLRPELRLLASDLQVLGTAFSDPAGSNVSLTFRAGATMTGFLAVEDWGVEAGGTYVVAASIGAATAAADLVIGSYASDGIAGLAGDDTITARSGDDTVIGGIGNDALDGGSDNDHLTGDAGSDTLWGGLGDDHLRGGKDRDVFYGGAGADHFIFGDRESIRGAHDVIRENQAFTAFELGSDVIDLTAIDADTTLAGDQAFIFDGTTGIGHVWLETRNDKTFVLGNVDGVGRADFVLVIRDLTVDHSAYTAGDFTL